MTTDEEKGKRSQILSWLINLSGLLVFVLILYLGGVEAWQRMLQADWRYVLAAFLATLAWNLLAAYRWSLIARPVVEDPSRCPFRYFFTYQMIGMLTGQVLPVTVGMLGGRPVALSLSRGVSLKRAMLSVFLDKAFDLLLAIVLVGPALVYLLGWLSLSQALGLMVVMVTAGSIALAWQYETAMILLGRTASRLARFLVFLPVLGQKLARRLPGQFNRLAEGSFVSNRLALQSFLLTVVLYGLLSARLFFISQALQLEIPWYLFVMGACVAQLALVFSITPGSLGFLEAGWAAVLGLAGLSGEQILYFLISRRAFVLVFTLVDTLLAFGWIRESPGQLFRAVIVASRRPDRGPGADVQPGSTA
ncbi:YbhN family protein [Chloroflexota bacterium]